MRLHRTIAISLLALVATVNGSLVQHESLANIPRGWSLHTAAAPADDIHMTYRIAVKQNTAGVQQLKDYMLDHSSNPASPNFGRHLTRAQINQMVKPHQHSVDSVVHWLHQHHITDDQLVHTDGSDFISFTAPISVGNRLLNTQYNVYKHDVTGKTTIRTQAYHLPAHLVDHIDFVSPATRFPAASHEQPVLNAVSPDGKHTPMRSQAKKTQAAAKKAHKLQSILSEAATTSAPINYTACGTVVDAHCIRTIYGFDSYVPQATDKNFFGINGFLGQFFNYDNLRAGVENFTVPYFGTEVLSDIPTVVGDGGNLQGQENAGLEADLDIQLAVELTFPTNITFFSTSGFQPYYNNNTSGGPTAADANEPYSDWLATVLGQPNVPQTISTSYGEAEETVGYNYALRVCDEFMELGAQGVSIIFATGDYGVSNAGKGQCYEFGEGYEAQFPASCPWVTSVGATQFLTDGSEVAAFKDRAEPFDSAGGFSYYFPMPDFQKATVDAYIAKLPSNITQFFNPQGRAFPDVGAVGQNCHIYLGEPLGPNGTYIQVLSHTISGSSMSTPIFASVISLINDMRLAAGKSSLGYLNPSIYAGQGTGFRDITVGKSVGCGPGGNYGYPVEIGWDAVTGFGSPMFGPLSQYLFALPGDTNPVYGTPFPASAFTMSPNQTFFPTPVPTNATVPTTSPATNKTLVTTPTSSAPTTMASSATTAVTTKAASTTAPTTTAPVVVVPPVVVTTSTAAASKTATSAASATAATTTATTAATAAPATASLASVLSGTNVAPVIGLPAGVTSAQANASYTLGQTIASSGVDVSNLATCQVIDPTRAEAPWHNSTTAHPQVFNANMYVCVDGNFLCAVTSPLRCGYACYTSSQYTCSKGSLIAV